MPRKTKKTDTDVWVALREPARKAAEVAGMTTSGGFDVLVARFPGSSAAVVIRVGDHVGEFSLSLDLSRLDEHQLAKILPLLKPILAP